MQKIRIKEILAGNTDEKSLSIGGWVKTHRQSKNVSFIELTDGSSIKGLQLVLDPNLESYVSIAEDITTGASIQVSGELQDSPAKGQAFELVVSEITLLGKANPETYPLQKKGHTLEFLREQLHLRPRSNTFGAVFRVRDRAAFALHTFFHERNFAWVHSPIITTSDGEGAGEMFQVTTLDLEKLSKKENISAIDYSQDFFKQPSFLTVTGQLQAEIFATSLTNVYTFGPTFRAENSNTTRHLAEFWMLEPEMAFCDLEGDMGLAEDFVKYILNDLLANCREDLEFFQKFYDEDKKLISTLESVASASFEVITYTEAISILEKSAIAFEFPVSWGIDLQTEHERYLTEVHVGGPVFVIDYPKDIKAFYMRMNDDEKTVAAMDLLVPRCGEIIGGSQREERYDVLQNKIRTMNLDEKEYEWYLDLRKYGTVPHAGFGLGFERLLMYVTGMQNVRDVIPCPRYAGSANF